MRVCDRCRKELNREYGVEITYNNSKNKNTKLTTNTTALKRYEFCDKCVNEIKKTIEKFAEGRIGYDN